MDLGLHGKAVLVTGASGGIGSATARALAAEGARVGVHYHSSTAAAEKLAAEIGGVPLRADLRDEAQADALVPDAVEALGGLDACVANAGTWDPDDVPVARMSLARWRDTIESNLTATFLTARAYLRHVEQAKEGSLVLVGSTAGIFGEAGHADYASAKAAMTGGLLLSLKNEVVSTAPLARVNLVAPGWTVSPMTATDLTPELVGRVTATMALRKIGETTDVANAVAWLCSARSASHITGQVITVAGGMEGRLLHVPPEEGL
jgi:3-oxoacyl-[acyl-carrier protein] reductase